jgi:hypothetical protein
MSNQNLPQENRHHISPRPEQKPSEPAAAPGSESPAQKIQSIQRKLGNRAVQRVLAQRAGGTQGSSQVEEDTEQRINSQRGSGQPLDVGVQQHMQEAIGYDFSGVRVHTSGEASSLSQSLQAKAFTTGQDVFFNQGAYQPNTSSGQELIAHELTHVAQQGSGMVPSSGDGMTVNAPGDAYEQHADATARQVVNGAPAPAVQRETLPEEEEMPAQATPLESSLQREGLPEEEEPMQMKSLQRQELDEEEAPV